MQQNTKFIIIGVIVAFVGAAILFTKEKSILRFDNGSISTSLIRLKSNDNVYVKCKFNRAGVLSNSAEQHGISAIVGGLIFRKLGDFSAEETAMAFAQHGIYKFHVDASKDDFEVSFAVLKSTAKEALQFLAEAFTSPKFTKNELEFVKQHFPKISDVDTTHPKILLTEKLKEMLYGNHNYGKNNTGTAQTISKITADDIQNYMKEYFVKNNLQIIFAGDISAIDISAYTDILSHDMSDGKCAVGDDNVSSSVSKKEIEIINKSNMEDFVGVIFGTRADNLSPVEEAALNILMRRLFDEKNGMFFEELRKQHIVHNGRLSVAKNKCSTMYSVCVFVEKKDLQKYYDFLKKTLRECSTNLKLNNFERTKAFFMRQAEIGFAEFSDIENAAREKSLPFDKVSYSLVRQMAKKIFANARIAVIGNNAELNQR